MNTNVQQARPALDVAELYRLRAEVKELRLENAAFRAQLVALSMQHNVAKHQEVVTAHGALRSAA